MTAAAVPSPLKLEGPPDPDRVRIRDLVYQVAGMSHPDNKLRLLHDRHAGRRKELVCRHFAPTISFPDPQKAYLAGLLHDLGIIVNLWSLPKEFRAVFERARGERIPLHEAEQAVLGFTHCDGGRLLAENWEFSADLRAVVSLHHCRYESNEHASLIAAVDLSDLLCRMSGLNYGYLENRQINVLEQPAFSVLSKICRCLQDFGWARLTFKLDSYMDEVETLVHAIYRK